MKDVEEDTSKKSAENVVVAEKIKEVSKSADEYDGSVLHRAVADAGRWAFGTVLVEMWVLSEDRTCLHRSESGWWIDPVYHSTRCGSECKLCRLTNPAVDDYVPPAPLAPGEGLPGVLWSESGSGGAVFDDAVASRHVGWKQISTIAGDPDQPWNPRLHLLAEVGLGWAGAVPFSFCGQQGIMVYMARRNVDLKMLQSPKNEMYLKCACDFAGAAYALRGPRRQMVQDRHAERAAAWRRIRTKILCLVNMGISIENLVKENDGKKHEDSTGTLVTPGGGAVQEWVQWLQQKVRVTLRKTRGGGSYPPPPFSLRQTLLTFIGAFSTLLMVTRLNFYMTKERGLDYKIILGPFGALVTLLYGLTAAPASQPRNAILGQAIALTISMAVSYADDKMELYMRQSLATALAVTAMVRLGITHPPAGAAALIFSSGALDWTHVLMMIVGNVIAIGTAVLINNLSEKRQYPVYWGVGCVEDFARKKQAEEQSKKKN